MSRRVAFVTGASRGIGKASALALADAGFDVAAVARTVREGERFEHSPTRHASDTSPVPGSLDTTAAAIRERGREVLALRADLLDRASLEEAVDQTLARWGQIDTLVNNAVYTGPGNLDRALDLPLELVERTFAANVFAQLAVTQRVVPGMLERGGGTVVNVTSHAAVADPPAPAGRGGWGLAYGASKGAFHRFAGVLHTELAECGLRVFNLDPGFVVTEMMEAMRREQGFEGLRGAPPRVPAAVVAWLATSAESDALRGATVDAQRTCRERALLPDWP